MNSLNGGGNIHTVSLTGQPPSSWDASEPVIRVPEKGTK